MGEVRSDNRKCWHCGRELTDRNSWMPTNGFEKGAPTCYCVSCQNAFFVQLAKLVGEMAAFFYCCVKFDVPYIPKTIVSSRKFRTERGPWGGYITGLRAARWNKRDDIWAGFAEGETSIKKALAEMKDEELMTEEEIADKEQRDKESNVARWGKGPKGKQYSDADYLALNTVYDAMKEGRSYVSAQSELIIKDIARWTLERDKLISEGEYSKAKQLSDMIEKSKESEQLRKKDEQPQDRARLDDIVLAVERAGLPMYDYDKLCEVLGKYMFHTPYGVTRDAADQVLLYIRNCTMANEGEPEIDRLPDEFAIVDHMGEFMPEPDEKQIETYKELGIVPLHMGGGKNAR